MPQSDIRIRHNFETALRGPLTERIIVCKVNHASARQFGAGKIKVRHNIVQTLRQLEMLRDFFINNSLRIKKTSSNVYYRDDASAFA